jgi:hypothetical protein
MDTQADTERNDDVMREAAIRTSNATERILWWVQLWSWLAIIGIALGLIGTFAAILNG